MFFAMIFRILSISMISSSPDITVVGVEGFDGAGVLAFVAEGIVFPDFLSSTNFRISSLVTLPSIPDPWICSNSLKLIPSVAAMDLTKGEKNLSDEERSEEHTSELQSRGHLVCRLLLE